MLLNMSICILPTRKGFTMKEKLIALAIEKHGEIFPCGQQTSFDGCFTYDEFFNETLFWFNLKSGSTTLVLESQLHSNKSYLGN
jgi:hypothetical protein